MRSGTGSAAFVAIQALLVQTLHLPVIEHHPAGSGDGVAAHGFKRRRSQSPRTTPFQ
jgi:hypothetical protein